MWVVVSENKVSSRIKRVIRESEKDLVFESVDSEGEGAPTAKPMYG